MNVNVIQWVARLLLCMSILCGYVVWLISRIAALLYCVRACVVLWITALFRNIKGFIIPRYNVYRKHLPCCCVRGALPASTFHPTVLGLTCAIGLSMVAPELGSVALVFACIIMGKSYLYDRPITYNSYRNIIKCDNCTTIQNLERFVSALDTKVRIEKSDPKCQRIIQEIDKIIIHLFSPISSDTVQNIRMRHSGSLYADLRVGKPYEADILLSIQRPEDWNKITEDYFMNKTLKLKDWILHGVKIHRAGCCLLLEKKLSGAAKDEPVGVLVDVIPILEQNGNIDSNELKEEVRNLWGNKLVSLDTTKHTLLKHEGLGNKHDFSTGFLENQLLDTLPEDVKRGYRVAKYLVQSQLGVDEPCVSTSEGYFDISGASQQHVFNLYGHKPAIKSHILRVFLIKILTETTWVERKQLKGGMLCICLLDMLYEVFKTTHLICVENSIVQQSTEKVVDILHRGVDNRYIALYALEKLVTELCKNSVPGKNGLENYGMFTKTDTIVCCTEILGDNPEQYVHKKSLCDFLRKYGV